jgi:pyruvate dehydrogenase E2 component (dihydrolipoamide acetyltransferase)
MDVARRSDDVATAVRMPQMGLEVTEGTVTAILVEVGAAVAEGDVLCEVETEKAVTEVAAPTDGIVSSIWVAVGDSVPVGEAILELVASADELHVATAVAPTRESDGTWSDDLAGDDATGASEATASKRGNGPSPVVKAAPVARRAAERLGVDLISVRGTGPNGRVTLADVESAALAESHGYPEAASSPPNEDAVERLSATRQAIARRMVESQRIPQYHLTRAIDADWLLAEPERLRSEGAGQVNVNDLLVQALAETVSRHPALATAFVDNGPDGAPALRRRGGVDVGFAVATDRGLLVPVIERARDRSLSEIAETRTRLVDRARNGKLTREEMAGATITISNLGGLGVDQFAALVNPGESAILAVGRPVERLSLRPRGIAVVQSLHLTMSFDHRVIDGAVGAAALRELAALLEGEMRWRP